MFTTIFRNRYVALSLNILNVVIAAYFLYAQVPTPLVVSYIIGILAITNTFLLLFRGEAAKLLPIRIYKKIWVPVGIVGAFLIMFIVLYATITYPKHPEVPAKMYIVLITTMVVVAGAWSGAAINYLSDAANNK